MTYQALPRIAILVLVLLGVLLTSTALAHSVAEGDRGFVDAGISFSVAYKALENLGLIERWLPGAPNAKLSVLCFGLLHELGLATKLQEFSLSPNGLLTNLIAFNASAEVGQLLTLTLLLVAIGYWPMTESFLKFARGANVALAVLGGGLFAMHLTDFF